MEPEQKETLLAFAKQQFAFLKTEKGFTRPLINRPDNGLLIYRNAIMGIRIEMDIACCCHNYMSISIGKLESKSKFPFANVGSERSLWMLQSFLSRQLGIQDQRILALDQIYLEALRTREERGVEQWKYIIGLYQSLLHDYIDQIVQLPFEMLFPSAIEYLSMWSTREQWEQQICESFAFLVEYGFRSAPVLVVRGQFTSYIWIRGNLGIRLMVDTREMDIYCDLVRLIDGKLLTTDKYVLKRYDGFVEGCAARSSLDDVLCEGLGISDPEIERLVHLGRILNARHDSDRDYRYISAFISQYAKLMKRYIVVLLETPQETLFAFARRSGHL